ncbi:acyl-CoA dehydrogenase family protein [Sandaracinobacter sp.]|uniref:acyl-CoA dehydrogenase family protein n=1 Tax=Sandaracinobacter sp. TaxID=2487581 RepID=UPI0035B16A13
MATATAPRPIDPAFEAQLLDSIDRWTQRELKPIARRHDIDDVYPEHLIDQMRDLGLFGATIGQQWGGLGLPATTYVKIVAAICRVWMAPTGIFNSHLMLAHAIERAGTPEQKAKWLPKLASGELRGGLALTEPDAGTDLQGIRTTARRDGDHYVLNGQKTWITNAVNGDVVALLARTDPDAQPRHAGMGLFIVDKPREGLSTPAKLPKMGYRAIDTGPIYLDNVRIPADQLIGGVEGQGFYQATGGLELGRINVAARGVGMAEGALDLATAYAQQRRAMGKPIAEHQAIQLKLGEMVTRARAARLLTLDAADAYDRGERCDMEAGMAKYFASEAARDNAEEAMRIHGGNGFSQDYEVERFYRDAMLLIIGEGTNEMQRIIVARQWVKRNPA